MVGYISTQLGTAQLGLAQLGQFKKQAPSALAIDASNTSVIVATATAFVTGGSIAGPPPPPLTISGGTVGVIAAHAKALSLGAKLKTPGLARTVKGSWWPWQPGELEFRLIQEGLEAEDVR